MKTTASPLKIIDFALTEMHFELEYGKERERITPFFSLYDVDIDFELYEGPRVFITAKVNRKGKRLPGYSFEAEAGCIFEFDKKIKLTPEEKNEIERYSTIYIALNSLRGLIGNITSSAPFGRYILPSIDLNTLINEKIKALQKNGDANAKGLLNNLDETVENKKTVKKKVAKKK